MAKHDLLPDTPSEWAARVRTSRHLRPHVSPYKLSLDGVKRLASASVLEFDDWLLLKILSTLEEQKPTPTNVLGPKVGPRLEKVSREYLEKQPWWQAVLSRSDNLDDWGSMEAWKKADLDITARAKVIEYEPPEYDLENLFAYKISVEPASRSSSGLTPEPQRAPRSAATAGLDTRRRSDVTGAQVAEEYGFEVPIGSPVTGSQYSPGKVSVSSISHRLANRPPDEALVNKAVVDLLQGISRKHPLVRDKYDWSIIHQTFYVFQQREAKERIMTSRTDGCLQVVRQGKLLEACPTLAIIEAKPMRRQIKQVPISMQEGAEMSAWISTESLRGLLPGSNPKGVMKRVLISQDFDEICITIAEYDRDYVEYITKGFKSAEMNSTQGSPTTLIQSRQKRPQQQPQQGKAKRHKCDDGDDGDDGDNGDDGDDGNDGDDGDDGDGDDGDDGDGDDGDDGDESSGGGTDDDDDESSGGGSDEDDIDQ